jgi:sporulation protein YlmC with PRC-barrel domain
MKRFIIMLTVLLSFASFVDLSYGARDKNGVLKASDVIGKKVQDPEGKTLGDIKDLVLNSEGDIEYAVLDFGGFLGVGDKYFAVPWEALQMTADQKKIVLDVHKKDLKNAPGFDKNHWPTTSDEKWQVTIYEFYEVPQPSEMNTSSRSNTNKMNQ